MKKRTKREKFLHEMARVVLWGRLERLVEPHYPRAGNGRQPRGLKVMLRIYCLQQWYGLSDPGVEEALYDMESMRRFAGLELGEDAIPDETTILNFRHLLERHNLTNAVFEAVKAYLTEQGLLLSGGSIVDATIIHAPPSTKNRAKQRDPEMSSTKKGNTWHFGMKAHISVDANSGLVHTVGVTTASDHDNSVIGGFIREDDRAVFGDKGYYSDQTKRAARQAGVYWAVLDKAKRNRKLSGSQRKRNKKHASVRAKVEHVFRIAKCQFGCRKVRYKGLAKNAAQVFSLMALANLYQARGQLLAAAG
ncbi:MAG: IS5 family transposase [Methyloglobulus sp.]|nr:IS5 family transposase [Methyloglobulus sp.]